MPYRFVDDVSIADVAFEATGATLEELFTSAGQALMNTQVKDLAAISSRKSVSLRLENTDLERLLHDFLQEIIFYKDAKLLLFSEYRLKVKEIKGGFRLEANLYGEELDPKKHDLIVDVKAVSWHMFKVERVEGGWRAFVILDV